MALNESKKPTTRSRVDLSTAVNIPTVDGLYFSTVDKKAALTILFLQFLLDNNWSKINFLKRNKSLK